MKIAITDILIETRRREEMGDLAGLAKSIEQYGLLHPVVLDDNRHLIAGMRRIEACKRLGWAEIEARFHGELTTEQRDRLELEENIKRKDLTIAEQSKNMKALAKQIETELKAREEEQKSLEEKNEFLAATAENSTPQKRTEGRPPKADAQQKVADAMGIPQRTLSTNLAYADAVEKYPDLATTPGVPMQDAIVMAKALDSLPDDARAQKVQALHEGQRGILADVRGLPPMPPPEPKSPDYQKTWSAGIKHLKQGIEKLSDDETLQGMKQKWNPEVTKKQHDLIMTFTDRLQVVCQSIVNDDKGKTMKAKPSVHLTPEGLLENLNLYFTEYLPATDQVVHLYDQRGWWPEEYLAKGMAKIKHETIRNLISRIRDNDGFRSVYFLKISGQERIVQEELFTSAKEYHVVIAEYYQARREGEEIVQHLNKNCYYRYGIEVPSYEDYLQNPDDSKWHMDEP